MRIFGILKTFLGSPNHVCYHGSNLTSAEVNVLEDFRADSSVTVRPADKGGRWVVMSTEQYLSECRAQLHNTAFYQPLQEALSSTSSRVSTILFGLHSNHCITQRELKFLLPPLSPKPRKFYILPKVHKPHQEGTMPPGRPIVSDVGSNTYRVAKLIEFFLNPLATRLPSHLRDSHHLIAKLNTVRLSPSSLFCTLDVRALYTNIPIEEGIRRVRRAFARHPVPDRPDAAILELLEISLSCNDFSFADSTWLQSSGVAMGKAFGGSFANLYMGEWETAALHTSPRQPSLWLRYQDDVFLLWDHGEEALHDFLRHLNTVDSHIQLDLAFSNQAIHFLDLELFRDRDSVGYRVWFKPTDAHLILPADSHHPPHTHRGVLYSQILRWATHCKYEEDFRAACSTVFPIWRSQGVSRSIIRSARKRVFSTTGLLNGWTPGFSKCGGSRCNACRYADERRVFTTGSSVYHIVHRLSCDTVGCVYVIRCSSCSRFYVGQTGSSFRQRISEHLRSFADTDTRSPLSQHFGLQCPVRSFRAFAIEKCRKLEKRLTREAVWIRRFASVSPNGLNVSSGVRSRALNLVTYRADCTARLNAAIRTVCEKETHLKVRFCYKTDSNLRSALS